MNPKCFLKIAQKPIAYQFYLPNFIYLPKILWQYLTGFMKILDGPLCRNKSGPLLPAQCCSILEE